MSEPTEKLLLLLLGWLLGLLSPVIVDAIKGQREAVRGRDAILSELGEVASVLVFATFQARRAAGQFDRPYLEWLQLRLQADASQEAKSLLPGVTAVLALADSHIAQGAASLATAGNKATILQRYPVPLLDARVSALWTFKTSFQRSLLQIRRDLALLDDIVIRSREFFRMTFSGLPSANHQLVSNNLIQTYSNYAERAEIIINRIVALPAKGGV